MMPMNLGNGFSLDFLLIFCLIDINVIIGIELGPHGRDELLGALGAEDSAADLNRSPS